MINDYKVGYKKPPEHGRFQKGQSGNPSGRSKKKAPSITMILQRELEALLTIQEGGKTVTISKKEALIKQFVNQAIKGKPAAQQLLLQWIGNIEHKEAEEVILSGDLTKDDQEIMQNFIESMEGKE